VVAFRIFPALAAVLLILVFPLKSLGTEFSSLQGYQLDYPAGWQIMTRDQEDQVSAEGAKFFKNVDFSHIDVVIYNPQTFPLQSVNVVVIPGSESIDLQKLSDVRSQTLNMLGSAGIGVESFNCSIVHVGDNNAILSSWIATVPFSNTLIAPKMREQQYLISGKYDTYVITCTSETGHDAQVAPLFADIVDSFQIKANAGNILVSWWVDSSPVTRAFLICLFIGILAVISAVIVISLVLPSSLFKPEEKITLELDQQTPDVLTEKEIGEHLHGSGEI